MKSFTFIRNGLQNHSILQRTPELLFRNPYRFAGFAPHAVVKVTAMLNLIEFEGIVLSSSPIGLRRFHKIYSTHA